MNPLTYVPVMCPLKKFPRLYKRMDSTLTASQKLIPEDKVFYTDEPNGAMYYYFGNTHIKVSEHFAPVGKIVDKLIESVIEYAAKSEKNTPDK